MNPRLLWGGLAATLLASGWVLWETPAEVEALAAAPRVRAGAALPADAATPVAASFALPVREARVPARRDLFAAPRVAAAPVVAAAVAAPPPPPRPTLPFTFGGRLATATGAAVLLNEGDRTHVLAPGGELGAFRLDADAGSRLEFTHIASGERLVLAVSP